QTGARGRGGDVSLTAGTAEVSGASAISSLGFFVAPPGDITVQVGSLHLLDNAVIQGGTFAELNGQSGRVTVRANDSILIARGAGISSQALSNDVGPVTVSAKSLTVDGGFIDTGTIGLGRAGNISIETGTLTLTNGSQITSSSGSHRGTRGGASFTRTTSARIA